ncbi:MAG TPA: sigma-70 family RNA polymerase sigma factor [Acidobacteriota bacterium]|nr:sigma-70 family RNA polymerase sigma factor [Acidobacteriota bacterium]
MAGVPSHEVTQLLQAWSAGDRAALDRLIPLVYDELHRLAHSYMRREHAGHILQTTALVNEAYLQLVDTDKVKWHDRTHFFAIAARLMRRILVDSARSRSAQKRGGKICRVSLSDSVVFASEPDADLIELDDALTALAEVDARRAKVVELRFFGGMTLEEAAEVLNVSADTVWHDWDLAKTWLFREMKHRAKR